VGNNLVFIPPQKAGKKLKKLKFSSDGGKDLRCLSSLFDQRYAKLKVYVADKQ